MKLGEMEINSSLIDQTELDEKETAVAKAIFEAYRPAFGGYALAYPPVAVAQLAIGATLRAVKANLNRSLVKADLKDLNQLKIPGME